MNSAVLNRGYIIKLKVYNNDESLIAKIARIVATKTIFYASRVKLIHLKSSMLYFFLYLVQLLKFTK